MANGYATRLSYPKKNTVISTEPVLDADGQPVVHLVHALNPDGTVMMETLEQDKTEEELAAEIAAYKPAEDELVDMYGKPVSWRPEPKIRIEVPVFDRVPKTVDVIDGVEDETAEPDGVHVTATRDGMEVAFHIGKSAFIDLTVEQRVTLIEREIEIQVAKKPESLTYVDWKEGVVN